MVLGNLPVPGRPTIWITVGQAGAGRGCLDIFTLIYPFPPFSPSLWETALYRLKYCLKGPLNPKQLTNWLPKLHKQPYKSRLIANSSSCSTTELSKLLISCLTTIKIMLLNGVVEWCDGAG